MRGSENDGAPSLDAAFYVLLRRHTIANIIILYTLASCFTRTFHYMKSLLSKSSPAVRLAFIYIVFSVIWILLSDEVVVRIARHDAGIIAKMQNYKGLLFVIFSGLVLYFTARKIYKNLNDSLFKKEELITKLNALNEAAREGIADYDYRTDVALINEQMKLMMGIDSTIVEGFLQKHYQRIHPADQKRVADGFMSIVQSTLLTCKIEFRYLVPDNTYRDVISSCYIIRDPNTTAPLYIMFALHDVTEVRDAKARYYEQQMKFKNALSLSIIEAQEKERNRWAEELHDNVCQVLTVAKLYTEQASIESGKTESLQRAQAMVETALNDIRHISSTIKPPSFSETSLPEAIEELVSNIRRFIEFEFHLDMADAIEEQLSTDQKLMLYRVVQEQLNNILKYADARHVSISLIQKDGHMLLTIHDDGKGFDSEEVKAGIGIKNIKGRLEAFGGGLSIQSGKGKGCELQAHFAL